MTEIVMTANVFRKDDGKTLIRIIRDGKPGRRIVLGEKENFLIEPDGTVALPDAYGNVRRRIKHDGTEDYLDPNGEVMVRVYPNGREATYPNIPKEE